MAQKKKEGGKMTTFLQVLTHWWPHFDEVLAYWDARRRGQRFLPGIQETKLAFWPGGKHQKSFEDYVSEGVLPIGTAGGRYDEHASADRVRTAGETAATLIGKDLGPDPAMGPIWKYCRDNDLKARSRPLDLATSIWNMYKMGREQADVVYWAMIGLDVYYEQAKRNPTEVSGAWDAPMFLRYFSRSSKWAFYGEEWVSLAVKAQYHREKMFISCEPELKSLAGTGKAGIIQPKPGLVVAWAETDNYEMGRFLRSDQGVRSAVAIMKNSRGQISVLPGLDHLKPTMAVVAAYLRMIEAKAHGRAITGDQKLLMAEGSVPGADEWYFVHGMCLNGALTAPATPPTSIPLATIVKLITAILAKA